LALHRENRDAYEYFPRQNGRRSAAEVFEGFGVTEATGLRTFFTSKDRSK